MFMMLMQDVEIVKDGDELVVNNISNKNFKCHYS